MATKNAKQNSNHIREPLHFRVGRMTLLKKTHTAMKRFNRSTQSPPLVYLERQKEVKLRDALKD